MKKWNRQKHIYEDFTPPDGEYILTRDMDQKTTCPQCGQEVVFGNCYTSMEIYTDDGFWGIPVCEKCYEKEWERRKKAGLEDE